MTNKVRQKIINAWAMYDWANSAFATVILTTLLPIYYQNVSGAGLSGNKATVYWGYTMSAALLIVAIISPVMGAMADFKGAKKRYLGYFVVLGITGTGLLYFAKEGDWLLASIFFIIGNVGFAGANVFYDSLLPHIARPEEIDRVSSRGFALGYLGGGILLAINLALIALSPEDQVNQMFRLGFVTVAIWWLIFSLPLIFRLPEAPKVVQPGEEGRNPVLVSLRRLTATAREIRKYRQIVRLLVAVWFYSDGIGTIIKMAVIVGAEIGITQTTLVGTILLVQFIAVPFAVGFGRLAEKIGTKNSIYVGLVAYTILTFGAFLMQTDTHFLLLGIGIAMVQGGTQALTRSLGARMIPKSKSGEFFGFVSITIKFAGIAGPAIFAIVAENVGDSRLGFLPIVAFFIGGIFLLRRVDVDEGIRVAEAEEAEIEASTALG